MYIKINGSPNDLIKRCDTCSHCIFEEILSQEQRQIKVLQTKIPKKHINRIIIEQLCTKYYDEVCPMKYAAMRASYDNRTAMQIGVIKIYLWDLGKSSKQEVDFTRAMTNWGKSQNLGGEKEESYALRYAELWKRGLRKITVDNEIVEKQILTADFIYESIMTTTENYINTLKILDQMIEEHKTRDAQ